MVTWTTKVKHLGNILHFNLDESADVSLKRGDLASRVNKIIGSLHGASDEVLMKVFSSKCCHFYGATAWRFTDKHVSQFHTMYNRCVRRILKLPYMTHTRFLPLLTDRPNSREEITARFVKMVFTASQSDNSFIKHILNRSIKTANSIIGSNIDYIKTVFSLSLSDMRSFNFRKQDTLTVEDKCTVQAIKDLKNFAIDFTDFDEFLYKLCVD